MKKGEIQKSNTKTFKNIDMDLTPTSIKRNYMDKDLLYYFFKLDDEKYINLYMIQNLNYRESLELILGIDKDDKRITEILKLFKKTI